MFESVEQAVVDRVLALVPGIVRQHMIENGVVLAGGALRDTAAWIAAKDLDIFCHSEDEAEMLAREASAEVHRSTFAYSVNSVRSSRMLLDIEEGTLPIQYVFYKDYANVPDLISQFDYRACAAAVYWDMRRGRFAGLALEGWARDCAERHLHFRTQPKDAKKLTALRRALHLAEKGWVLDNDNLARIILHWQGVADGAPGSDEATTYTDHYEHVKNSFRPAYTRI